MDFRAIPVDANSAYHVLAGGDCTEVNPITYFGDIRKKASYHIQSLLVKSHSSYKILDLRKRIEFEARMRAMANKRWADEYNDVLKAPLTDELLELLQSSKKKKQQKLIKLIEFDSSLILRTAIYAWRLFKMPFSRYTIEYRPKDLEDKVFPQFLHKKDAETVAFGGKTNLSEKQMHKAIDDRHRLICNVIGNQDQWYCFFWTMAGINGKEAPHVGEPHIHYISSAYGIPLATVLKNLLGYRYTINAETISFVLPKEGFIDNSSDNEERTSVE
jgi:hypothetical protein